MTRLWTLCSVGNFSGNGEGCNVWTLHSGNLVCTNVSCAEQFCSMWCIVRMARKEVGWYTYISNKGWTWKFVQASNDWTESSLEMKALSIKECLRNTSIVALEHPADRISLRATCSRVVCRNRVLKQLAGECLLEVLQHLETRLEPMHGCMRNYFEGGHCNSEYNLCMRLSDLFFLLSFLHDEPLSSHLFLFNHCKSVRQRSLIL
jgi:hypothetical protein